MNYSSYRLVSAAVLIVISNVVVVTAAGGLVLVRAVTSAPTSVQSGYDASERFCGTTGEIQYVALRKQVEIRASLTAEKPNRQYSVIWQNNKVRGYTIGVFSTNASGEIRPGSLRLFRAGEVRGVGVMIYYRVGNTLLGAERFKPCQ
jgi:hypothetical protein